MGNHLHQTHRDKEPEKALYVAMKEEGSKTFFICLSRYKEIVPVGQVLLTESVCCSIFGSLRLPQYQELRFHELPTVNWAHGLNRSDPLQSWRPGHKTIGRDLCLYRRLRTLDNCLNSGPMRVTFIPRQRDSITGSFQFNLFEESFRIPTHIAKLWKLQHGSIINVQWQIASKFHPHAFTPRATIADDGRRVGIRIFSTIQHATREHWIIRDSVEATKVANTLYDFLTYKIVGKDYEWNESRKYIFQNPKYAFMREENGYICSGRVGRRGRIGLPCLDNEFIWDDETRAPEAIPKNSYCNIRIKTRPRSNRNP